MRTLVVVSAVAAVVVVAACDDGGEGEGEGDVAGEGEGEGEGEGDVTGEGEGDVGEGEGEGDVVGEGEGEGEGDGIAARFVAVGYGGRRFTSDDGRVVDNDQQDVPNGGDDDRLLRGACSGTLSTGETVVLAVGGSAQGRVARSVDGGETWTQIVDNDGWIGACAFADDQFVFVGSARSARSLDGGLSLVDRQSHFLAGRGNWQMRDVIARDDGSFLAVGDTGVARSDDGFTWTDPTGPSSLFRVAEGNGVLVAVGGGQRAVSVNGVDWSNAGEGGNDIVFGDGRFVIVGEGYGLVTENGVDATRHNQPPLGRVAFGVVDGTPTWLGFNFPAVRRVSTDGENWQNVADDRGNAVDDVLFLP